MDKKIKVHLNLQEVNTLAAGIGVFENELTLQLMKMSDLELSAAVSQLKNFQPADYERFHFPIKRMYLPARCIFDYVGKGNLLRKMMKMIPVITYNRLAGAMHDDVYLFFSYRTPIIPIRGKVIGCIHDMIPYKTEMEKTEIFENYKENINNTARQADLIVTVSQSSKKDIIEILGIPESKIVVVYDGVDAEAFSRPSDRSIYKNLKAKYDIPEKYILYFGSSRKHKNVEAVVSAYYELGKNLHSEYGLVISNPSEEVKKQVKRLGLNDSVRFVYAATDNEKIALYQHASTFVFVSLYEGFGIPVLEAMAAGVPVVTSNCSALPEVAGDAALIVDPNDVSAIANAIAQSLTDTKLRKELIAKGYINIKRFTWENAARKLHEAILQVASRSDI